MKIRHQSFRGKCLFCGARTQNPDPSPAVTREAPEDILWRPERKSTGSGTGTTTATSPATSLPSGRTAGSSSLATDSRQSERPSPPSNGIWHTTAGPIIEDLYDDCPQARFHIILFSVVIILPLLFLTFDLPIIAGGLVLGILFFKFQYTAEQGKWYGLRDVQSEYESLLATASFNNRNYYNLLLGPALSSLLSLRDRAFKARSLILGESFEEIDYKINWIENRARNLDDPDLSDMYQSQVKDLKENRKKLEQISILLERFEASKNCMVESIKLLKSRILLSETRDDRVEEAQIREDLKSLHFVYERINHPHLSPTESETTLTTEHQETLPTTCASPVRAVLHS
ncbi:MAG TPA: hypothetical protein PKO06_11125 [Candidatus Ozemobacteraceae bacterium]|nr:hypothetical protein [Candidatus Ozemobacteraceae bacterium]